MKIGIVGLGLIGGSFARKLSALPEYTVYGMTRDRAVTAAALSDGAISAELSAESLGEMDLVIVALPPDAAIAFLGANCGKFGDNTIVIDICGVKRPIKDAVASLNASFTYIGTHPMAGREVSGYAHSSADLFDGRSMIIMNDNGADEAAVKTVEKMCLAAGFGKIVYTNSDTHDRIIAYTSQLCHIASNAFIKSPTSRLHYGFSGGSFEDLTRVAYLDENMWTTLFTMNKTPLLDELERYIDDLILYRDALKDGDGERLRALLREGKEIKQKINDR